MTVEEYTKVLVDEYKDSLVDIDDIDVLKEAISEAYFAGLQAAEQEKIHETYLKKINKSLLFTLPDKSRNATMIAEFDYSEWHYIKDGILPNTEFGRVDVTVAYINAYENPCKMDCCFDGTDFIYWDDRKPISWKKVDIFGKIYAWKYQEKLPEPPKESEK